jgi:hypothetical protein
VEKKCGQQKLCQTGPSFATYVAQFHPHSWESIITKECHMHIATPVGQDKLLLVLGIGFFL